jgi:hypothetical protein
MNPRRSLFPIRIGFRRCRSSVLPVLFLATLLRCPAAMAQQRFLLEETYAAKGKTEAFEVAQKDYCAAVVRGGAPECLIFSPTTFSPGGEYLTLLRFSSFSHYDEGTYTSRGLAPQQAAELKERRGPTIGSNRESALSLDAQVSYTSADPGALVQIVDLTIQPGTLPRLLTYLRTVALPEAHRAGLLSSELYQVVAGAETNRFLLIRRMKHFQDLDRVAPFGDTPGFTQGAQASILGCVTSNRTTVMRVRMDLGARQ